MSDIETLKMALIGYQIEQQKIQEHIRELEHQLGGYRSRAIVSSDGASLKRQGRGLSAAARKRIAEAQRKRWEVYRNQHSRNTAAKRAPAKARAKRKMSADRRAALLANLKKARAARAAKRSTD